MRLSGDNLVGTAAIPPPRRSAERPHDRTTMLPVWRFGSIRRGVVGGGVVLAQAGEVEQGQRALPQDRRELGEQVGEHGA
ncbi:hypothetical protein [Streptomyces sp. NBC_00557]|uniref:hypothetical protein n=1 Tax=Streptomyces sp. NBC_00557 TaxID=2975776 RepID=UPI002E80D08E|nr:hypothetical protein [Streptomyces sp. NBC_00557]WUC34630.1 hypothetical protein OG956_10600 [Streptomyces sp. NBC_00557]